MKEILPGAFHWTRMHPKIKLEVSSYYLSDERVLIDPLVPDEGLEAFPTEPKHVLLTNRHHYRDSGRFQQRFGCDVWCAASGVHEFTKGENVTAFQFGQTLAGGILAVEIGVICPDETVFVIFKAEGLVALADGVVRDKDGPLGFVPDEYMGDEPEGVKAGLKQCYQRLMEHDFDHLLLAHGWPWIGGGKQALREFVES